MPEPLRWTWSTLGAGERSLGAALDLSAAHGLDGVELRALAGSLDLAAALAAAPEAAPGGRARGLVRALDSGVHLAEAGARERVGLLALAAWADRLDCPFVRVFGRAGSQDPAGPRDLERAAATLAWWRGERARLGLAADLLLETHDAFSSSASVLALAAAAGPVAVLWDVHHTWCAAGEAWAATWRALGPLVRHVHVKDSRPGPGGGRVSVPPGAGDVPVPGALALLRDAGFAGPVSLEWERWWEPHLPPVEQALAALVAAGWRQPA